MGVVLVMRQMEMQKMVMVMLISTTTCRTTLMSVMSMSVLMRGCCFIGALLFRFFEFFQKFLGLLGEDFYIFIKNSTFKQTRKHVLELRKNHAVRTNSKSVNTKLRKSILHSQELVTKALKI